ncbi:DoxX family protein [Bacillus altitudinis]|uniref:DoxX family protein n=1 Tax=Bacillus altitudinis TaxID=293387 RepID=UPI003CECA077
MKRILHIGSTYAIALLFIAAGVFHVIEPSGFARMMSGWPFPYGIIYATACLEWLLAVLLLLPNVRIVAAKMIAVYLVLIFPANLFAAREGIPFPGQESTEQALLWMRLIGQPILIGWAMSIAKREKKTKTMITK